MNHLTAHCGTYNGCAGPGPDADQHYDEEECAICGAWEHVEIVRFAEDDLECRYPICQACYDNLETCLICGQTTRDAAQHAADVHPACSASEDDEVAR